MAAVTLLISTFNTTSGTKTAVVTPAVGDQIIIIVAHTGNVTVTAPTDTASGTYTLVNSAVKLVSADWMAVYVRDQLIASAASTTFTTAPGTTTGGGIVVLKAAELTGIGNAGVRQSAKQDNAAAAAMPTITFGSTPRGGPVIYTVFNGSNPPNIATLTGYSALATLSYSTPTAGLKPMSLDSGETRTTIPGANTSATESCTIAVELLAASHLFRTNTLLPLLVR